MSGYPAFCCFSKQTVSGAVEANKFVERKNTFLKWRIRDVFLECSPLIECPNEIFIMIQLAINHHGERNMKVGFNYAKVKCLFVYPSNTEGLGRVISLLRIPSLRNIEQAFQ